MRYPPLLIALFTALTIKPLSDHFSKTVPADIFLLLLFAAVIYAFRHRRRLVVWLALLGLGSMSARIVTIPSQQDNLYIIGHGLAFLLMVIVLVAILGEVLRTRTVTTDLVVGAVCLYFVIGLSWAFLYYWIYLISPGSIFVAPLATTYLPGSPAVETRFVEVIYFSLSCLTTLGSSGEETVTTMVRQLAVVESVMGQLYLAVLVSRLVGFSTSSSDVSV